MAGFTSMKYVVFGIKNLVTSLPLLYTVLPRPKISFTSPNSIQGEGATPPLQVQDAEIERYRKIGRQT